MKGAENLQSQMQLLFNFVQRVQSHVSNNYAQQVVRVGPPKALRALSAPTTLTLGVKMKGFIYFSILILGAIFGYLILSALLAPVQIYAMKLASNVSHELMELVFYTFIIPKLAFAGFLIFRLFVCIKNKTILLPDNFKGGKYIVSIIAAAISWVAIIFTIIYAKTAPIGSMSGVPLALVIMPTGLIAFYIMLKSELPAIKKYRESNS
jgi:hypothetical protein